MLANLNKNLGIILFKNPNLKSIIETLRDITKNIIRIICIKSLNVAVLNKFKSPTNPIKKKREI